MESVRMVNYMEDFELKHDNGRLVAFVTVNGIKYKKDITEYIEKNNPIDDWLDYRLGLKKQEINTTIIVDEPQRFTQEELNRVPRRDWFDINDVD